MPIKTTALIRVTSTQERGKKPVVEITLPERLARLIRSARASEMKLNLGPNESIRISAEAFRRIIEETYAKHAGRR